VIAMPGGDVVARIDGPDRRGWVFAGPDIAFYPVMRSGGPNTVHRLDLREGSRARLITDDRAGARAFDVDGPVFTSLAVAPDGRELLVARALADGPRAWLGRYDAATGRLLGERSWPIRSTVGLGIPPAAGVRIAAIGDAYVLVAYGGDSSGRPVAQQMHVVDGSLREIASPAPAEGLADHEACSPQLARVAVDRWATLCSWRGWRHATVLFFDAAFRVVSQVAMEVGPAAPPRVVDPRDEVVAERDGDRRGRARVEDRPVRAIGTTDGPPASVSAWAGGDGAVGFVTDQGTHVRVSLDGEVRESRLVPSAGRTYLRAARQLEPAMLLAQWVVDAETAARQEFVRIDLVSGRVLARFAAKATALDFAAVEDRLYALVIGEVAGGPRLQRLDPASLAPVGDAVPVPARDDISVAGITAIVRGR
jgi:hypothetical protein